MARKNRAQPPSDERGPAASPTTPEPAAPPPTTSIQIAEAVPGDPPKPMQPTQVEKLPIPKPAPLVLPKGVQDAYPNLKASDCVEVEVPASYRLRMSSTLVLEIPKGTRRLPKEVADHPYSVANGVSRYKGR